MVFDIRGVDDVKLGKISLRAKLLNIPSCGWYFEVFEPPRSWEKKRVEIISVVQTGGYAPMHYHFTCHTYCK